MILRKFINDNDTLDGSFRLGKYLQNRTEVTITVAFTVAFTITITN